MFISPRFIILILILDCWMSKRVLPFYNRFFDLFERLVIEQWEAKTFINNVLSEDLINDENKKKIYKGINVLYKCGYLTRKKNPKNSKVFLYTEAQPIVDYRAKKINEKIEKVLKEKMNIISDSLNTKSKEALFISELKAEYPEIACQIDVIQQEHLQILNDLSTKKNVIKKLMQHFNISEF